VTSGDKDPNNPDLQTFNALFPKGAYFGELSPIGPYNHTDLHPAINLKLHKQVELLTEWVWYWRTSARRPVWRARQSGADRQYQSRALRRAVFLHRLAR